MLICKNDKIVVTGILRKYVVNWYHAYILNPGADLIEAHISNHYYWPNLRDGILDHIKVCNNCKNNKK